jgi:hypothetical protein
MLLVYAGVGWWVLLSLKNRNWVFAHLILFGVVLYLALVSAGLEAYYRFRVPMTPSLVLLAGSIVASRFTMKQPVSQNSISRSSI